MKKISAYYRIIQNLTCMGFFFTLIFAVKSFENAVPDEIYVRAEKRYLMILMFRSVLC
jgi:stage IV sporulation protein B